MVFAAILAAHHAWTGHGAAGGASLQGGWHAAASKGGDVTAQAHTQSLDGSGSGCGPTGGNCSGSTEHVYRSPERASQNSYKLGTPPDGKATSHTDPRRDVWSKGDKSGGGFFGENKNALPANRGYVTHSFRDGSQQNVGFSTPENYTGYAHTGMTGHGLFKFYGAPAASHSASAMVGHNPDGGVHAEARRHAFGNGHDDSSDAMYLPAGASGGAAPGGGGGISQLGFYGSHHTMAWGHSVTETNALPEQVPVHYIQHSGGIGAEANFITAHGFSHSHSLARSTALQHSGQATPKNEADFIASTHTTYGHTVVAQNPESVAFASQTMRMNGQDTSAEGILAMDIASQKTFNDSISKFNKSMVTSSAYAMTAGTSLQGSRILSTPYHSAKVKFCSLHPDMCFFSPAPETQSVEGGYHSI